MIDRISPKLIILNHLETLKNFEGRKSLDKQYYKQQKYSKQDVFTFFITPIMIAIILLLYMRIFLTEGIINTLITVMSILGALLFNLLLLVFDSLKREQRSLQTFFLQQVGSNVSFAILNTLICLVTLVCSAYVTPKANHGETNQAISKIVYFFNGISYYLLTLFFLTFLMILRRFDALLQSQSTSIKEN